MTARASAGASASPGAGARGVVCAAVAPLLAEARIASEQTSQLLRGQQFSVEAERGDWLHVTAEDGYKGWINRGYTESGGGTAAGDVPTRLSLGCVISRGAGTLALPFGALLFDRDVLVSGEAVSREEQKQRFPPDAKTLTESALKYFAGTPYQWGGVSPWGADCSGFLQNLFSALGIVLPRDSGVQALQGSASNTTPGENGAGELLFFSEREDGRITHVGLALGGSRMAHVALGRGGFAVEDFSAADVDPYAMALRARFRFARKVI